jgi:hypothetical protein
VYRRTLPTIFFDAVFRIESPELIPFSVPKLKIKIPIYLIHIHRQDRPYRRTSPRYIVHSRRRIPRRRASYIYRRALRTRACTSHTSVYLTGVHLTGAYLMDVCLTGVHLMGVCLMGVYLMGVYLTGVHLTGVHLIGVYLIGVHLMDVRLIGVHLMGMHPIGVHLMGIHLIGVHLMGVHLIDVHLIGVHLMGVTGYSLLRTVKVQLLCECMSGRISILVSAGRDPLW